MHGWDVIPTPRAELCHLFPQVQGDNASNLDFGAVQRGDPEMEQKMNRVIRACVEAPRGNPICSLHDQGAGGNGERRGRDEGPGPVGSPARFGLGRGIEDLQLSVQLCIPSSTPSMFCTGSGLGWGLAAFCQEIIGGEGAAVIGQGCTESGVRGRLGKAPCLVPTVARSAPLLETLSPGNVLKELSDPAGAVIYTSRFQVGVIPTSLGVSFPCPSQVPPPTIGPPTPSKNVRLGSAHRPFPFILPCGRAAGGPNPECPGNLGG